MKFTHEDLLGHIGVRVFEINTNEISLLERYVNYMGYIMSVSKDNMIVYIETSSSIITVINLNKRLSVVTSLNGSYINFIDFSPTLYLFKYIRPKIGLIFDLNREVFLGLDPKRIASSYQTT